MNFRMKNLKSLSIIIATFLAIQKLANPTVLAIVPALEQKSLRCEYQNQRIQNNLLKMLFFRPDLIELIKSFLPDNTQGRIVSKLCYPSEFLDFLQKNKIEIKNVLKCPSIKEDGSQYYIKKIIKEDNLNLLQKEIEKEDNINITIVDSFFELENMNIPILHYCIMKNAMKCFKFLILSGANPLLNMEVPYFADENQYKWNCITVTICFGNWEMMKILEERGVNKINNTNVWEAAALTHRNQLLNAVNFNKDDISNFQECLNKAMLSAIKGNNLKGLKILLSKGANVNAKDEFGRSPLHYTVEYDSSKISEVLISMGSNVNAKNNFGETPLHFAATYNANKVAEILISKEADVSARDNLNHTPLHCVSETNANEVATLLIIKGVDISAKNNAGRTSLHCAAMCDADTVTNLLISKGANVNEKDNVGLTALHLSAVCNANKVAKLLISKKADINAKDKFGRTPLQCVTCYGTNKVTELLKAKEINEKSYH